MFKEKNIYTIAFEGLNRVGKSTQIELIKNKLDELGIPCVSIRGEGYRDGKGDVEGNPESDYWTKMSEMLRNNIDDYEMWNEASYRLAREMLVWRDRILKNKIKETLEPFGVLLVDRSLISNSILKTLQKNPKPGEKFSAEELYPENIQDRKQITTDMVLPDLILELIAPKDVLLARLKEDNPDYEFKKNNIENKYKLYREAKLHLPDEIQDLIETVDSSKEPEEVYQEVVDKIASKIPDIKID